MIHFRFFAFIWVLVSAWRLQAAPLDLPLVQDFELTDGGLIPSSTTSWKWGPPTAGPHSAHSGTQVWGTNLTSNGYSVDEDAVLKSSLLDLTGATGKAIVVHWWQYLVTEEGYDEGFVEVSKDGGGTWETIFGPRSGIVNDAWTQHTALLDPSFATASFVIRFRLVSDFFPSEGGFFVDDLRISATSLTTVVPLQDFEAGNGGYVASGTNSSWAFGTPVTKPGRAYSGVNAWATNLNGLYNPSEDSTLTSPVFNLSASAGKLLVISWRQFLDTEEDFDFAHVEVSNDSGATWAAAQMDESGPINPTGWTRRQAFVNPSYATAGFRLRFHLVSDGDYQFAGWAVDDVAIDGTTAIFPSGTSFSKTAPQNTAISFTKADFSSRYSDPDGGGFTGITVLQLPASGTLQLGAVPVTVGQVIPAASLNTLSYLPLADTSSVKTFTWSASNFFGASIPATVTLSIIDLTPQIVITKDPESQTVNPNSPVTLSVTAVSTLPLTYQWRKNTNPIQNATGPSIMIAAAAESDQADYDVVVTNTADETTSVVARLDVNDPVTFDQQPTSVTVNEGVSITLHVAASGTGRLDYQWTKDGIPIPDATFSSLPIVDAKEADGGDYRCVVTNIVGAKPSDPATVTLALKPRITQQPISRGITVNGQVTFTVQASGAGPFTYQWLKGGEIIPGATGDTIVLKELFTTNEGDYSVRVSNGFATVESDPATLQVFAWSEVTGVYQDVLEPVVPAVDGTSPRYPGRVTVAVTAGGSLTSTIQYQGRFLRLKGKFDTELGVDHEIKIPLQAPLVVHYQLDPNTLSLSATVLHTESTGDVRTTARGFRSAYDGKTNPAPQRGRYTVVLQKSAGSAGPDAPVCLLGVVSSRGRGRFVGKLPNGQNIMFTAYAQFTGRASFYYSLYAFRGNRPRRSGELGGRLNLPVVEGASIVSGDFAWRKPEANPTQPLPAAFLADLDADGSRYTRPTSRGTVIPLSLNNDLLELNIAGPITGAPLQRWVRLAAGSGFVSVPISAERIDFRLQAQTGEVIGSYTDPNTNTRFRFQGVALQTQDQITGMILHIATPGTFLMTPAP